ncbi:MAG: hypothetical protein AOA65_0433 [Candidatus Bathyarchaeota archaeon BA1]|nr:MAG: hypothetical protein AOA65_0433 [Candidatus Bathyarchaeota archaeon BA1]
MPFQSFSFILRLRPSESGVLSPSSRTLSLRASNKVKTQVLSPENSTEQTSGKLIFCKYYILNGGFIVNEGKEKLTGFVPRIGKIIDLRLYEELKRRAVKRG